MQFYRNGNQDLIHRNLKEIPKCVQIIYSGKAFAFLPLVDCPRFLKAEVALQISNSQAALHAQASDVVSRGDKVNHGIGFYAHDNRLLQESDIKE
jgi:hypothetical protein